MTDLLQQILADPELGEWPRYGDPPGQTADGPQPPAAAALEETTPPISADRHDEHQSAVQALRPYLDENAEHPPTSGDPEADQLGFVPPPTVDELPDDQHRTAETPEDGDATAGAPPDRESHNGENTDPAAAPLAFDDIAAKRNALTAGFVTAHQWLQNRNWKSPRTIGAAAAAIIAAAALGQWTLSAGEGPQAPTAQLSPSTSKGTSSTPAPAPAPADLPIVAATATARCPAPSSDPMNALRAESTKPWICVQAWGTVGQILEIVFDKAYVISQVSIMPGADGDDGDQDMWNKYRTVRLLTWSFNDVAHTRCEQDTRSQRQTAPLDITAANCYHQGPWQPVVASAVTITIRKTDQPSNPSAVVTPSGGSTNADYTAFAVSHLEILGHPSAG